jgi:hypothetical protein
MNDELIKMIENEREQYLIASSYHDKMEIMNSIIQIKRRLLSNGCTSNLELFLDVKRFLKDYTLSLEEVKHGYDGLDFDTIFIYFNMFDEPEQLSLAKYFIRILYINGFEKELKKVEDFKRSLEIRYYWSNKPLSNFLKLLYLLTTYNIWTIMLTMAIIIVLSSILILPSPDWMIPIFNTKTLHLSSSIYFNNLFNFIGNILGVNEAFKIEPLGLLGMIILIFGKLFIIVFVINILIKEFTNRFKY